MSVSAFGGMPPVDPAFEPAAIRNGGQAAKNAYKTGLALEQTFVQQLSQELASSISSSDDGSGDGSGSADTSSSTDSSDSSSGIGGMGSDPASSTYADMLPTALTSAIMSSGGTGMAYQIALALDPEIGSKQGSKQ